MPKFAIITDGSLTPKSAVQPDKIVPFYVNYKDPETDEWEALSGEEMSVAEFLNLQVSAKSLPKTSLVLKADFIAALNELIEDGYDRIVIVTVPEGKSGTYKEAKAAKEEIEEKFGGVQVGVVDSGTTGGGVEYLVEVFREASSIEGTTLLEVLGCLEEAKTKVVLFLALDSIRFIGASGRIPALSEKHWKETLEQFAKVLVSKIVSLVGHSPKVFVTFAQGKEHINRHASKFLVTIVEKINEEIFHQIASGKKLRKVFLYCPNAGTEGLKVAQAITNLDGDIELYERDDDSISLALYTTAGPKFVAVFCVFD